MLKYAPLAAEELPDGATPLMRELARLSAQQAEVPAIAAGGGLAFGECVAAALRAPPLGFTSLPALLPVCDRVAIDGDEEDETSEETGAPRPPTTFRELCHFLTTGFDLAHFGVSVRADSFLPSNTHTHTNPHARAGGGLSIIVMNTGDAAPPPPKVCTTVSHPTALYW